MDVAAVRFSLQGLGEIRQRVAIKLVVAENIDDRLVLEVTSRPFAPLATKMDVTGQHDNICIGYRNFGRSKFQVQIAENVQTHSQIRFESSAVFEIKERAEAFASARVVASWRPWIGVIFA